MAGTRSVAMCLYSLRKDEPFALGGELHRVLEIPVLLLSTATKLGRTQKHRHPVDRNPDPSTGLASSACKPRRLGCRVLDSCDKLRYGPEHPLAGHGVDRLSVGLV